LKKSNKKRREVSGFSKINDKKSKDGFSQRFAVDQEKKKLANHNLV
jgi:hypothetical protein